MIALITPTGARPYQFHLCTLFMKRQTYPGKVIWVIIDDCVPRTTNEVKENFRENWTILKTFPAPPWQFGQNTQARNIAAGIRALMSNYSAKDIEAIFIIEDDDYYKPSYLENMMPRISKFWAAGEKNTIYYNVYFKRWCVNGNDKWSSLFQTCFIPEALPTFESCYTEKFIDFVFFRICKYVNLFNDGNLAIGIKGQPGRYGIGAGHGKSMNMIDDIDWQQLRKLIGDDTKFYDGSYGDNGC